MSFKVYVGNLTPHVNEKHLTDLFLKYGVIQEITMKNGFAFIVSLYYLN